LSAVVVVGVVVVSGVVVVVVVDFSVVVRIKKMFVWVVGKQMLHKGVCHLFVFSHCYGE
jgi:hypothetical protein